MESKNPKGGQRLFVALTPPSDLVSRLAGLRPSEEGMRPVAKAHLHLTLTFIGEAESAPIEKALEKVDAPTFELEFQGPGVFVSPRGTATLWLGVGPLTPLQTLRRQVNWALEQTGWQGRDSKSFTPHITLARYKGAHRETRINAFRESPAPPLPKWPVHEFCLYSSQLSHTGPEYQLLRRYSLRG